MRLDNGDLVDGERASGTKARLWGGSKCRAEALAYLRSNGKGKASESGLMLVCCGK